jgi:hypothetical protein
MGSPTKNLSKRQKARHKLWTKGIIGNWYLYDYQQAIVEFLRKHDDPFIEAARQIGKTTTIIVHSQERALKQRFHVTRWCEPWKNQAREIVKPEMDKQNAEAREGWASSWTSADSYYLYPSTMARLYLRGVNEDGGRSARGPFADVVVADEFGFWNEPEILEKVLKPQLGSPRKAGRQAIVASTPPENLGHVYYVKRRLAEMQGRFMRMTIRDIGLSQEQLDKMAEDYGGWESEVWRREYLCEEVADPKKLVIPEFDVDRHVVDDSYPRPTFFTAYTGADLGFEDFTGMLFVYFDFHKQEVVVEDEICVAGKNSMEITSSAIVKEKDLWGIQHPHARWSDNDPQLIYDMGTLHGYWMTGVRKRPGYKFAAVNEARIRFQMGKVKIKRRCKQFIHQLRTGMWAGKNKSSFMRGETTGHLDLIDAFIHVHDNIDFRLNPWPRYPGAALDTHVILEEPDRTADKQLEQAFSNPYEDTER